jgi:hypothetical protein
MTFYDFFKPTVQQKLLSLFTICLQFNEFICYSFLMDENNTVQSKGPKLLRVPNDNNRFDRPVAALASSTDTKRSAAVNAVVQDIPDDPLYVPLNDKLEFINYFGIYFHYS